MIIAVVVGIFVLLLSVACSLARLLVKYYTAEQCEEVCKAIMTISSDGNNMYLRSNGIEVSKESLPKDALEKGEVNVTITICQTNKE